MKKKIFGFKRTYILIGIVLTVMLLATGVICNQKTLTKWQPDESVVRTWRGSGNVFIDKENDSLAENTIKHTDIEIVINEEGTVTGSVGNAKLKECYIALNRTAFERAINVKTDMIITGQLEGPMVTGDATSFREISFPLNIVASELGGSIFSVEGFKYPDPIVTKLKLIKE